MLIDYARISTLDQDPASGARRDRPQLAAALKFLWPSDTSCPPVNAKPVLALALVPASPCLAQTPPNDPGTMRCADYLRAAKGASESAFGNLKSDDTEADAMMKELGQQISKVCSANPKITVREAIQRALMEED